MTPAEIRKILREQIVVLGTVLADLHSFDRAGQEFLPNTLVQGVQDALHSLVTQLEQTP